MSDFLQLNWDGFLFMEFCFLKFSGFLVNRLLYEKCGFKSRLKLGVTRFMLRSRCFLKTR